MAGAVSPSADSAATPARGGTGTRLRILFFLGSGLGTTFEWLLRALLERGHELVVAIDPPNGGDGGLESLRERYPGLTCEAPPPRRDLWGVPAGAVRRALDYLRYLDPERGGAEDARERARERAPRALRGLLRVPPFSSPGGRRWLERVLRRLEAAMPLPRKAWGWVEQQQPDVIAISPLVELGSKQADYPRIANALRVPAVLIVSADDDLAEKGTVRDRIELSLVRNSEQADQTTDLHGLPHDRVEVADLSGANPAAAADALEHVAEGDVEPRREGRVLRAVLWALTPLLVLLLPLLRPVTTARAVAKAARKAWRRLRKRLRGLTAQRRARAARAERDRARAQARAEQHRQKEAEKTKVRAAQAAEKEAERARLRAEQDAEKARTRAEQEAEKAAEKERARRREVAQRQELEAQKAEAHALKVERIRAHNEKIARAEAKRVKEERAREKAANAAGAATPEHIEERVATTDGAEAGPVAAKPAKAKGKAKGKGDLAKRVRRMRGRSRKAIRGRAKVMRRRWKLTKRGVRRVYNRRYRWSYRSTIMRVPARDELPALLNARGLTGKGVEIGVKTGLYSNELLTYWKGEELISIDPWLSAPAEEYVDRSNVSQDEFEDYYRQTRERLEPHGSRSTIWRMTSVEAAPRVPDHSLDFVYIDARHDYDSVLEDLAYWCSKVKPGGILAGHDYVDGDFEQGEFYVKSAVDEFFGEREVPVRGTEGPSAVELFPTWIVEVPERGLEPPATLAADAEPAAERSSEQSLV